MKHVPRTQWAINRWAKPVHTIPTASRDHVMVHYHGGPPAHDVGIAVPREAEAIHRVNGWAGVGYNWLIDMAGTIYEGRGWNLLGAHCPNWNTRAWGVYLAVGGTDSPTIAALNALRAVHQEATRLAGRRIGWTWHGEHHATECPGPYLKQWVVNTRAETTRPAPTGTGDADMPLTDAEIDAIAIRTRDAMLAVTYGRKPNQYTLGEVWGQTFAHAHTAANLTPDTIASAIVARLAGTGIGATTGTPALTDIKRAIVEVLTSVTA